MKEVKVLIVEDEIFTARDLQMTSERLGYTVTSLVPSAEEAIETVKEKTPDIVLMDIVLQGEMDGIEAAEIICSSFDIPIIYLTAHSEEKTLKRVKISEPFGYMTKPFGEKELQVAIDMALHKHNMEKKLKRNKDEWIQIFDPISDFVSIHDRDFRIVKTNTALADYLNVKSDELIGKYCYEVYHGTKDVLPDCPHIKMLQLKKAVTEQVNDSNFGIPLLKTVSPIFGEKGEIIASVHIAKDISKIKTDGRRSYKNQEP